jgi:E3 ubiquitin-protein ligase EDD1
MLQYDPDIDQSTMMMFTLCAAGIHVLTRSGNKLSYVVYNLSTGKVEQDSVFPTDTQAFLGTSPNSKITLHNGGEVRHIMF